MADVFVIAHQVLVARRDGRQVRRGGSTRLHAGLLLIGHDRHRNSRCCIVLA